MHQADPYRELRQICVYILMRNSGRLLAAAKAQKLAAELETQQKRSEKGWMDPEFEGCEITLNDKNIQKQNHPRLLSFFWKSSVPKLSNLFREL